MQNSLPKTSPITPFAISNHKNIALLVLAAASIGAVLLILGDTVKALVATWSESNVFSHCFLIIPIALYLVWRRRAELAAAPVAPDWRGGAAVALAALLWLLGAATGTLLVQEASLVVIIQALILAIYGRYVFRVLLFPLLFLFFAVPFGMELIPPLQTVTAILSVALLKLVGVPVYSDGYLISVPTGNWYVADACSGIRYVIASLALGALFAGTMYVTWWRRALVFLVAVAVPIAANGVRAFGIILIAYLTDNEVATGIDHLIYGWLFFTLVSFVVLAIGMSFRETNPGADHPSSIKGLGAIPLLPSVIAAAIALLPVGAARAYGDYIDASPSSGAVALTAPEIGGYDLTNKDVADHIIPDFNGADAVLHAAYEAAGQTVYLRVGYYDHERRGGQAVSPNHELYGNPDMLIVGKGKTEASLGETPTSIRYQRMSWGNGGRVIWYWYWVDGHMTGDPYYAKLLEAKAKLFGGSQAAAIIAIAADYRASPDDAEAALRSFARQSHPLAIALDRAHQP
jgi:exosortase A